MESFIRFYNGYQPGQYQAENVAPYFWWAVQNGLTNHVNSMLGWGMDFSPYAERYVPEGFVFPGVMLDLLYPTYYDRLRRFYPRRYRWSGAVRGGSPIRGSYRRQRLIPDRRRERPISRSPSPRYSRSPSPRYSRAPSPRYSRSPSPQRRRH